MKYECHSPYGDEEDIGIASAWDESRGAGFLLIADEETRVRLAREGDLPSGECEKEGGLPDPKCECSLRC